MTISQVSALAIAILSAFPAFAGNDNLEVSVQRIERPGQPLNIDLKTDKAIYNPGQPVVLTASQVVPGAKIRYRHGAEPIGDVVDMTSTVWRWTPPADDFKGYLVEIFKPSVNAAPDQTLATIAVDVSSDWKRFPRYGFIATFDLYRKSVGVVERETAFLNRCHINGVQFQDWHYKHHWPLGGTPDNLLDSYLDIANRPNFTSVIKHYISTQHGYGMKSIFYNLCYGVLDDAAADGVSESWNLYKSNIIQNASTRDKHSLPEGWKSDIFLVDPSNADWQNYIVQRNNDVYASLDFDGFQIDQLGNRGDLYNSRRQKVDLPSGFASFINAMKAAHPDKRLIMNAVGSFATKQIVSTGNVDFCYNETWGDEDQFYHLRDIIATNEDNSNGSLRTVFASYMNYDKQSGYMNTPGVLLTDAVIMALGGAHLELGDHMLSHEYFPLAKLDMSEQLKEAMIHYYDFMTAYQNLLRDSYAGSFASTEFDPQAAYDKPADQLFSINYWPPRIGAVTAYARRLNDKEIVHLLNFRDADNLSWRDLQGTRLEPQTVLNIPLKFKTDKSDVKRVWAATPDNRGGAPVLLDFSCADGYISTSVPSLKYWTMIVVE